MGERLFFMTIWAPSTRLLGSADIVSSVCDLRYVSRAEAFHLQLKVDSGTPDIKLQYRPLDDDGEALGTFADNADVISSSDDAGPTQSGLVSYSVPSFLASKVQFKITNRNAQAVSILQARLYCREST